MRPLLSWLHVSDLHAGQGGETESARTDDIVKSLIEDAVELINERGVPAPEFLLVTGDLTFSGGARSSKEFDTLDRAIDRITREIPVADGVLAVPGNHDVDRQPKTFDSDAKLLVRALRTVGDPLDDALVDDKNRERLLRRFAGYAAWVEGRSPRMTLNDQAPLTWTATWDLVPVRITMRGVNSAWLAFDGEDKGLLQVGVRQLGADPVSSNRASVTMLALHHPVDWLRDREAIGQTIDRDYDVVIHGHLHQVTAYQHIAAGHKPLTVIGAGATHKPEGDRWRPDGGHTYNLASIGIRERDGRLILRLWPRLRAKGSGIFGPHNELTRNDIWHDTVLREDPPAAPGSPSMISGVPLTDRMQSLLNLAESLKRRYGRRRTAFPTDLSIAELSAQKLAISPRFVARNDPVGVPLTVNDIIAMVVRGDNVLILGEPGLGKSVSLFEVIVQLREINRIPLVYRLSDVRRIFESAPQEIAALRRALSTAGPDTGVVLVDGLDEASVTEGPAAPNVARWLDQLAQLGPLIVTCRTEDYETHLGAYVQTVGFNTILMLQRWGLKRDLKLFVDRLVQLNHLPHAGIYDVIVDSQELSELAETPLFARMLTLIGSDDVRLVRSEEDLYRRFFAHLSSRTQADLADLECTDCAEPRVLWERAAWLVFTNDLIKDEAVNYSALVGLVSDANSRPTCVNRALHALFDVDTEGAHDRASFIHYSFYEYLLAAAIADRLAPTSDDAIEPLTALRADLPRRVRHFLTKRIQAHGSPHALLDRLIGAYQSLRSDLDQPQARTICNLIAYLVSRGFSSTTELSELLKAETDAFLRNSLRWALSHLGDMATAEAFIDELRRSANYAAMCRGYLLYYHGDLDVEAGPPFFDSDPAVSWTRTRAAVTRMMRSPTYAVEVPAARRVIDVYTYCGFALLRNERLTREEEDVARAEVDRLWNDPQVRGPIARELQAVFAAVTESGA